jgi:hypothetical protein
MYYTRTKKLSFLNYYHLFLLMQNIHFSFSLFHGGLVVTTSSVFFHPPSIVIKKKTWPQILLSS